MSGPRGSYRRVPREADSRPHRFLGGERCERCGIARHWAGAKWACEGAMTKAEQAERYGKRWRKGREAAR